MTTTGLALGITGDRPADPPRSLRLEPGDVLVLYSDGLTETRSTDRPDRRFGEQRVRRLLAETAAGDRPARLILERLVSTARRFADEQREDDVTVVVVRRE